MPQTIKISADSTCDLSPEQKEYYQINIVPLYVQLGEAGGKDGVDIFEQDIFDHVSRTGQLPKTAAPSVADYQTHFSALTQDGSDVIHVNISADFSSSFQNATIAAEDFPGVYVVDSRNLSAGHGHVVLEAARLAQQGINAADIATQLIEYAPKVNASFIINQLDYLHKGGRCSSVAALGANLLKLKPCIEVTDGKMHVGRKYRGNFDKVLTQYVADRLAAPNIRKDLIFITHTKCPEGIPELVADKIRSITSFDAIVETEAGSTITSHCGPGTLGILYVEE